MNSSHTRVDQNMNHEQTLRDVTREYKSNPARMNHHMNLQRVALRETPALNRHCKRMAFLPCGREHVLKRWVSELRWTALTNSTRRSNPKDEFPCDNQAKHRSLDATVPRSVKETKFSRRRPCLPSLYDDDVNYTNTSLNGIATGNKNVNMLWRFSIQAALQNFFEKSPFVKKLRTVEVCSMI